MEVYHRITERVRGAMWAHHRKLMPERQFKRILGYVYSNKYEYQIRFDRMTVVGTELGGKIEVACTPAGHVKRIRVNPCFEDLSVAERKKLLLSAYSNALKQGRDLMQEAETKVYNQFLRDLKPLVMGIRDNPEFYTVADDTEELASGTLQSPSNAGDKTVRTIPYARAFHPTHEWQQRTDAERRWLAGPEGMQWAKTLQGKQFLRYQKPELRPKGAPGAKRAVKPFELLTPYTNMDERELMQRNWQAFLDNKHVAEVMWTRSRLATQYKAQRQLQKTGQAWHSPINKEAETRW